MALKTLRGHLDAVTSVAFSPDGQRIVTGSRDKTAKVWDAASGKELLTLKGHRDEVTCCGLFPGRPADCHRQSGSDGQGVGGGQLAGNCSRSRGTAVRLGLWPFPRTASGLSPAVGMRRPRCGMRPAARNCLRSRGTAIGFCLWPFPRTASGLSLAVGMRRPRCGRRPAGGMLLTLKGHTNRIWSVAFSPDGQRIVAGSADGTAKVWDAASGEELLTLKGHTDRIRSVAFSPDGQRIVTGSGDQTAKVWEAASGRGTAHAQGAQRSDLVVWPFPRTASGLSPAVGMRRPRCGMWPATCRRPERSDLLTLKGTAMGFGLWPFPRTASGLSLAVGMIRPRCGRRPAAEELLTLKGTAMRIMCCGLFPGRPADCHRQFGSDGQGVGCGQRARTAHAQGAQRRGLVCGLFPGRPADCHRQLG